MRWEGVIYGEPASKANSRKAALIGGKPRFIKSEKARNYASDVARQISPLRHPLTGPLRFTAIIYYVTHRPDLDESLILDALQGRIYENDRQIHEKHIYHRIDKRSPRAEVVVECINDDAPLLAGAAR